MFTYFDRIFTTCLLWWYGLYKPPEPVLVLENNHACNVQQITDLNLQERKEQIKKPQFLIVPHNKT